MNLSLHSFHIPVMGLAYTIDTPIRVAQYGISSAISVMDDELIEQLNCFYSQKFKLPYQQITKKVEDFRAKRITAYLDTLDTIVQKNFQALQDNLIKNSQVANYFLDLLPSTSFIAKSIQDFKDGQLNSGSLKDILHKYLKPGEIDVNIMTKVDRQAYLNQEKLPKEYNDAHAALRGYANSKLNSSVVLSAGINPELFTYFENFDCFFPSENGQLQKKIILKVSDYRSALIQGNFLAKKGLWVSEYRVESGLNCGGHAFATQGLLLGPILQEFKDKKQELIDSTFELLCKALQQKQRSIPLEKLPLKITAQGGVGTHLEHEFLMNHYNLTSVGWGSPFLLVPQATSVDAQTRKLLQQAKEKDLFLSDYSPLGIAFNTLRGTSNDRLKQQRIQQGKPGSSCPRKYLALDNSYDPKGLCTASSKYQKIALEKLREKQSSLSPLKYKQQQDNITQKACLCIGLANASLLEHSLDIKGQDQGVVICPGPNIAYFSKELTLKQMVQHIYGKDNVMHEQNRPHFFIKELYMYLEQYKKEVQIAQEAPSVINTKRQRKFRDNLLAGIKYYKDLFLSDTNYFTLQKKVALQELDQVEKQVEALSK